MEQYCSKKQMSVCEDYLTTDLSGHEVVSFQHKYYEMKQDINDHT